VRVISAQLKRDVNTVFKMWPWVAVSVGQLKEGETKYVQWGGMNPKFVDEEFTFELTRFDPKNIKFVVKSKRITLVDYENAHDHVAEGMLEDYPLMLRDYEEKNYRKEDV
jgi:hypothetical protein